MGRGGRKKVEDADRDGLEPGGTRQHWTDTHPDRYMWSPGRLAQARTQTREEYEALYGRSALAARKSLRSPLFPSLSNQDTEKLEQGTFTGQEAREFLAGMRIPSNFPLSRASISNLADDPVLQAFWKSEMRRMEEEKEMFAAEGISHWSANLSGNEERAKEAWFNKVVASWLWRPGETGLRGWNSSQEGLRRMQRLPHSITAAAIESGVLEEHVLAQNLFSLSKKNEAAADNFFDQNIKTEIDYLTLRKSLYYLSGPPADVLLAELWKLAARNSCDRDSIHPEMLDVEQNMNRFSNFLPPEEREVFRATPLVLDQSKAFADGWDRSQVGLFQEAWARKGYWDYDQEHPSNQQDMVAAANGILGNHLLRVYSGLDGKEIALDLNRAAKLRRVQAETVQNSNGLLNKITNKGVQGPLPLDNLRPIFVREEAEDQFEILQKGVRRFLADGHSFDPEESFQQDPVAILDPSSMVQRFLAPKTVVEFDSLYNENFSFSDAITSRIKEDLQNVFSIF